MPRFFSIKNYLNTAMTRADCRRRDAKEKGMFIPSYPQKSKLISIDYDQTKLAD